MNYRISTTTLPNLTANNLLDKKRYSRDEGWTRQTYFGDPRNVTLTLRSQF